ncbi:MAG: hypothetical protein JSU04_00160 [Bdellovibrionales bacterium]|nr:hypothetical protein [Bdellovibrionales bacterium]
MRVVKLNMFMTGGIEMSFEAGRNGFTVENLDHMFKSLESNVPSFAVDLEDDGQSIRQVFKTSEIYFYRAVFGKDEETFETFFKKVSARLQEVEFNHNIKTIFISEHDHERFGFKEEGHTKWLGRRLMTNIHLQTGEVEMLSDKGDII